ncbi:Nucleoside diphosphate kinase [Candidatus Anstonella stagnisolia]|nr:Nucleoside diphosphate kinase [Candidatus Anstonella stagnisolia]
MMERTLIILKPDCMQRRMCGEVFSRFEKRGFKVAACKMLRMSEKLCEEHYAHIKDKPFFPRIKEFMTSAPVIVMVLEGKEIVRLVRDMLGVTNARNAAVGTIRGDFALSNMMNLVHASDSVETAQKEIARFFKKDELFEWKGTLENSTYGTDEL